MKFPYFTSEDNGKKFYIISHLRREFCTDKKIFCAQTSHQLGLRVNCAATVLPETGKWNYTSITKLHCEPKKHTKMFLIYSLQNQTDCDKFGRYCFE